MEVAIDFTHTINLIRYIDSTLSSTRFQLRADLVPVEDLEDIDFDIVFAKIKFWLDTIVSRCIAFSCRNETAFEMLLGEGGEPRLSNHLMITPEEPQDDHLAVLLQSKLTALAGGKMQFGCIRIESDSPSGLTFTYVGDWQDDLPPMQDWFSKRPYYFDQPWWTRDDVSTLDIVPVDDADFSQRPIWAMTLDFIENSIRPPISEKKAEQVDVPVKGNFKPKIINGGIGPKDN
jgi:hypothetical protein